MKRFLSKSLPLAVFAFMVATFFMPDLAFAQGAARSPTLENFAQTMSALVHILTAATLLLLQFMPPLWGTDLITGPEIIGALKPLWMYIRNIMNMVFVILLIVVIFINLLTSGGQMGGGQWTIKEKLGKIILGLVAVNFSLLAVKVLVDAAYVGTIGLLSLADTAIDAKGTKDVEEMMALKVDTKEYKVCEDQSGGGNCKPVREIINDTFCKSGSPDEDYCLFKVKDKIETENLASTEKKNVVLAFGVHFMRLESLPILAAESKSIFAVLDNALFSFVMAVAYILALVAVFVVLIVRVCMMWVMILLSPILVTGWVLGWSGGAFEEINGRFWKYLIVPVKIAAVFAFTFVLIATLDAVTPSAQFYTEYIEPGNPLKPLWGDEKFMGWQFVWKIFIVVLFWKAIFLAIKDIDDVSTVTSGIQNFGSGLAKTAMTYGADQIQIPGIGTAANIGQVNAGLNSARAAMTADAAPTSASDVGRAFGRGRGADDRATRAQRRLQGKTNQTLSEIRGLLQGASAAEAISETDFRGSASLQSDAYRALSPAARAEMGVSSEEDFKVKVSSGDRDVLRRLGYDGTDPTATRTETPDPSDTTAVLDSASVTALATAINTDGSGSFADSVSNENLNGKNNEQLAEVARMIKAEREDIALTEEQVRDALIALRDRS